MTDSAIIAGSLVDVRNVGTHKSVKLTVHVPAELAQSVFAAFGWPTGVAPVSVAIARLVSPQRETTPAPVEAMPRPVRATQPAPVGDSRKSPAQIAGYLCTTAPFQKFLRSKCSATWAQAIGETADEDHVEDWGAEVAARAVRRLCRVKSRSEITEASPEWSGLLLAFRLWENHPELEDA